MARLKQYYLFKSKMSYISCVTFIFLFILGSAANADDLFFEDFNTAGDDINRSIWTTPEGNAAFFGRTAIRNPNIPSSITEGLPTTIPIENITVENGVAKLRLDTYNPTDPNTTKTSFWGSEMDTQQKWKPSGGLGISFEARVRSKDMPQGVVTSMFGYNLISSSASTSNRDEIDFEFLSNHYNTEPPKVLINYFRNEPTNSAGAPELLPLDIEFKFEDFHTFRIDLYEDEVQWYIDDNLLKTKAVEIPSELDLRFNIWAPDSSFSEAFDASLIPAQSLAENQSYFYEVDWVRVSVTPEPISSTLFLIGSAIFGLAGYKKRKK